MSARPPAVESGLQDHHRRELDRFADALWLEHGLARNTLAGYRSDLARFAAWLEARDQRLPAAASAELAAYLAEFSRSAKPASQRRLLATWRRYYRMLLANREIAEDPTLLLLTSGVTLTWAHHGLLHNNRGQLKLGLFLTIALGVVFLGFQAYEYMHAYSDLNVKMTTGVFGSVFYMLTGFHGFHVTVGATMLIVILCRVFAGHFSPENHFGFEAVAWYWHFVDVVWLLLFVVVYWI